MTGHAGSAADRPQVAASVCRDLEAFAGSYGIALEPLAQSLSLNASEFEDFDTKISLNRVTRLFEVLATVAGDEAYGLKYGINYRLGGTGAYGYGLINAPTLRDALEFMIEYYCTVVDLSFVNLEVNVRNARIEWTYSPIVVQRDQFNDFAAATVIRALQQIAGTKWNPKSIELERLAPREPAPYRKALSSAVQFNRKMNAIIVPLDALEIPNPNSDRRLFELMRSQCEAMASQRPKAPDFPARVKDEILRQLQQGDINAARIARLLAVSERSLQRRMSDHGLTFYKAVEEVRKELSDRLLHDTKIPLIEIAHRLGFASPSAYTRAAIRWYGHPPRDERMRTERRSAPRDVNGRS
ncbi:MAG: AraC family transcriptional regulator ligand-binding domain-containing protein [Planctomycetota bacterium]